MIFGKIAYGQAQAPQRIAELITELLDQLGLRTGVMAVGLDSPVGIGGGRLSLAQRQKLGARPRHHQATRMLVLYDARAARLCASRPSCVTGCWRARRERTVMWALQHDEWASAFDQVMELHEGRLVRLGPIDRGRRPRRPKRPSSYRRVDRMIA